MKFDLLIVESNLDFVAVESGSCYECVERKLDTKIINSLPITGKEFMKMKQDGLQGFRVKCECDASDNDSDD